MRYALFLRGINVAGIRVPMPELRDTLAGLRLGYIKTYLQTGNVTFESPLPPGRLKPLIESTLGARFHYQTFVLLFNLETIRAIVDSCPFSAKAGTHRYAVLCASQETADELAASQNIQDNSVESVSPGKLAVFWQVQVGRSVDTPFAKQLAKPKYKPLTTNRNIQTLQKLLLAEQQP